MLRPTFAVRVQREWDGRPCDALIALHARRSAPSIEAYARHRPNAPLAVVLTGTDLYGDLAHDVTAQRSLQCATRLVVLNELGLERLPPDLRPKTDIVLPSATPLRGRTAHPRDLEVAVVGHLRDVKDPLLAMAVAQRIPPQSRLTIVHVGKALERELGRAARATARRTSRYRWLGGLTAAGAREVIRAARVLLHPSKDEGGATVIVEALQSGTLVIASNCAGNVGLLGADYPGFFAVGDADAALLLLLRVERDADFVRALATAGRLRARLTTPAREARALTRLVHNLLETQPERHR
jgi:putative glycosyltransferase (TIGR04348 family)